MRTCEKCGADAARWYQDPERSKLWKCLACGTWNSPPKETKKDADKK